MNTAKRISSFVLAVILVFSSMVFLAPAEKTEAATASFYTQTNSKSDGKFIGEKIGGYYVWIENVKSNGNYYDKLYTASKWGGSKKTIKSVNTNTYNMGYTMVTDGNKILFAVKNRTTGVAYIFKTFVNGSSITKVATIPASYKFGTLAGYYNGRIYYVTEAATYAGGGTPDLYKYNLSTKQRALCQKNFYSRTSYGKLFVSYPMTGSADNWDMCLYDASKGTKKTILNGMGPVLTSNRVIYWRISYPSSYRYHNITIYRATQTGLTKTKLTSTTSNAYGNLMYMGRAYAIFHNYQTRKYYKYTYSTNKYTVY